MAFLQRLAADVPLSWAFLIVAVLLVTLAVLRLSERLSLLELEVEHRDLRRAWELDAVRRALRGEGVQR